MAYDLKKINRINLDEYYDAREIADLIGISRRMLYQLRNRMEANLPSPIPVRMQGRTWCNVLTGERP